MPKSTKTPGSVLNDLLKRNNKKFADAARELKIPYSSLYQLGTGRLNLSMAMALRFAKYFGTTVNYWIDLQNNFDLENAMADKSLAKDLTAIKKIQPTPEKPRKTAPQKAAKTRGRKKAAGSKTVRAGSPSPKKAQSSEKLESSTKKISRKPGKPAGASTRAAPPIRAKKAEKPKAETGRKPKQADHLPKPKEPGKAEHILIKQKTGTTTEPLAKLDPLADSAS